MDGQTIQHDDGARMRSRTAPLRRVGLWVATIAVLVVMLLSYPAAPTAARTTASAPSTTMAIVHAPAGPVADRFVHPPVRSLGRAAPRPSYGSVFYTQVGATIAEYNNSATQTGVKALSEDVPLVSSPYPIGYELNGLTNKGDWFQIVVGVNWAGCPGLDMITEVWNNQQSSGPVGCSDSMTLDYGDLIRLGLNFSSGIGVCMDFTDVTRSETSLDCQSEPDSGASEFVTLPQASNANGYFTGPMTEIANTTASSCPDYTHMPLVNYEFKPAFGVSEYVPWSDEFDLYGGQCYSNAYSGVSFAATDPTTNYVDTAQRTGYGPHYVAGQLYSLVDPSYGFRIQTDPVPLGSVTLTASKPTIPVGGNVTLNATVTGGASPYTALWALNGTLIGGGSISRVWVGAAGGSYRFQAYGVDKNLDVDGPSTAVTVLVNGPLAVSAISTDLPSGNADIGQTIVFLASATGGVPPYTYVWSGLPTECPSVDAATLSCTPSATGTYTLQLSVSDTNHTTVLTATRPFAVSARPAISLDASVTRLDTGQPIGLLATVVGGAGNLSYAWGGLPQGCVPVDGPSVSCAGGIPGLYTVSISVTDANGIEAITPGLAIQVFGDPSVALGVNRAVADAGVAITFTVTPTGGAGGYSIVWTGLPIGCAGSDVLLLVCTPTAGGTYSVSVNATDSVGRTAASGSLVVFAYAPLNLTVAGPSSVAVGGQLTASVNVSGGAPGVTYSWSGLPEGCSPPESAQLTCQPATAGAYNITVTVTDGGGGVSSVQYRVVVVYPPTTPTTPQNDLPFLLLLGLLAVVAVVLAAIAATRRRSRP
jgi:PKD domain-containing protein